MHVGTWAHGHVNAHYVHIVLTYPAHNAYAPYCDDICGPSVSANFFNIISQTVEFLEKSY
jgi:hypothetical protein